jgi:hypothetical protein
LGARTGLGLALLFAVCAPGTAAAHALPERYDLPLPLGFYLVGAAAAVAVSFVALASTAASRREPLGYPRGPRLSLGRFRVVLQVIGVAGLLLVVAAGLSGNQSPLKNIAPVLVWVLFWVGFAFVAAFIGNAWPWLDPWRSLFAIVVRGGGPKPVDGGAGWPAVALLLGLAWLELVWEPAEMPRTLALTILAYSLFTWAGMALYGRERWCARVEVFSVFFATLGRFAPISGGGFDRDPPGQLRPWAVGLLAPGGVSNAQLGFVMAMLATVTFDGLLETPAWSAVLGETPTPRRATALASAGLLAAPAVFFLIYFAACAASARIAAAASVGALETARRFALTLVPIAVAYHFAHYVAYLLLAGQYAIPLASDPLGIGWDLFGTTLYRIEIGVLDAASIWRTALVSIVLGHVAAVWLAHRVALDLFRERAVRAELPLVVLMLAYTMLSLWILAQPVVEAG